ncbi:high-affinity branched-chain amino acid transporter permease [Salmonella enterica subsp. enterica serovar Typhimurium]|nr:high-affinity branched-chain amino acid transporter permease [Salmonella enterica subsp. enterica serovar Typhimurium]
MKPMHIAMALFSAAMFFVLAGVFMGVQLELDGTKTGGGYRRRHPLAVDLYRYGSGFFFFQLLRPMFQKAVKHVSGPKVYSAGDRWLYR